MTKKSTRYDCHIDDAFIHEMKNRNLIVDGMKFAYEHDETMTIRCPENSKFKNSNDFSKTYTCKDGQMFIISDDASVHLDLDALPICELPYNNVQPRIEIKMDAHNDSGGHMVEDWNEKKLRLECKSDDDSSNKTYRWYLNGHLLEGETNKILEKDWYDNYRNKIPDVELTCQEIHQNKTHKTQSNQSEPITVKTLCKTKEDDISSIFLVNQLQETKSNIMLYGHSHTAKPHMLMTINGTGVDKFQMITNLNKKLETLNMLDHEGVKTVLLSDKRSQLHMFSYVFFYFYSENKTADEKLFESLTTNMGTAFDTNGIHYKMIAIPLKKVEGVIIRNRIKNHLDGELDKLNFTESNLSIADIEENFCKDSKVIKKHSKNVKNLEFIIEENGMIHVLSAEKQDEDKIENIEPLFEKIGEKIGEKFGKKFGTSFDFDCSKYE